jgi:glycosyltransferase involved in cell wall biosynthesis
LIEDAELREKLASAGRERARLFSWERTARLTAECYERAWAGAVPGRIRDSAGPSLAL